MILNYGNENEGYWTENEDNKRINDRRAIGMPITNVVFFKFDNNLAYCNNLYSNQV